MWGAKTRPSRGDVVLVDQSAHAVTSTDPVGRRARGGEWAGPRLRRPQGEGTVWAPRVVVEEVLAQQRFEFGCDGRSRSTCHCCPGLLLWQALL